MAKEVTLKMRYCSEKCDQCLFSKNKIVSDERKKEILQDLKERKMHFFCHKGTLEGENIICYGSMEAGHNKELFRDANTLGMLVPVDPKTLNQYKP